MVLKKSQNVKPVMMDAFSSGSEVPQHQYVYSILHLHCFNAPTSLQPTHIASHCFNAPTLLQPTHIASTHLHRFNPPTLLQPTHIASTHPHCFNPPTLLQPTHSFLYTFSSPDFTGAVAAIGRSVLGRGSASTLIHLDEVQCTGSEVALSQCHHSDYGINDCTHAEDAGVICES